MIENSELKVEVTDDGSSTILVSGLNEHYHSVRGAFTESCHIFRDCAFRYKAERTEDTPLRLLEVGFGTGLNAAVTAMAADELCPVHYISLEKYPLSPEMVDTLNYEGVTDGKMFRAIHGAAWDEPVQLTSAFTIEKRHCDYLRDELPSGIDVVYFDAFAPEKQPDMWTREAFSRLVSVMNAGAVLTTYCAKGEVRRMLASLGLVVERLAGPLGGKREILRAVKM